MDRNSVTSQSAKNELGQLLQQCNMQKYYYDFAMKHVKGFSWIQDLITDTVLVNNDAAGVLGYATKDGDNDFDSWLKAIHPDDADRFIGSHRAFCQGETDEFYVGYRSITRTGDIRWMEARGVFLDDEKTKIAGVIFDITQKKNIELELEYQSKMHDFELACGKSYSFEQNPEDGTIYYSNSVTDLYGYTIREMSNKFANIVKLIYPDDAKRVIEEFGAMTERRVDAFDCEYRVIHKSGAVKWVHCRAKYLDDASSLIHGICFDITDRKVLELQRMELLEHLQEQKLNTKFAMEVSKSYRFKHDFKQNTLIGVDVDNFLGHPVAKLGNRPSKYLQLVPKEYRRAILQAKRNYFSGKKDMYSFELPIRNAQGTYSWILLRGKFAGGSNEVIYGTAVDITEKREYEDKLASIAYKDALTNHYNLQYLLGGFIIPDPNRFVNFGAIVFDIKGFKEINRTYGYQFGNELVIYIIRKVESLCDESLVIRMSGDHFLLLKENSTIEELVGYAKQFLELFRDQVSIGGQGIKLNFNIGISLCNEVDMAKLISDNDIALYYAKRSEKCNYCIFTEELRQEYEQRIGIERELKNAIIRDEFELYYQPKVSTKTGLIEGAEALIRWRHPERGIVLPDQFIPSAEETGLIIPIGEMVIQKAIKQIAAWNEKGFDLFVAINMSSRQFMSPNIKNIIFDTLRECNVPTRQLVIEITESLIISDFTYISSILNSFRECGIGISLDDFGTGYSSMSYLTKMPLDDLKIDKELIANAQRSKMDQGVLESIVIMAHRLNLRVTAEGVETKDQLDTLIRFGCDYIQGYYYSKPVCAEDFFEQFHQGIQ